MKKRVYAIIMVLIMIITLIPLNVSASTDDKGLFLRYSDWNNGPVENIDNPLCSSYESTVGFCDTLFFYYVTNGVETRLNASDLVSSDENVVKISKSTENADGILLEMVGVGNSQISYVKNGVTHSMNVMVNSPQNGFSLSNDWRDEQFIRDFTVTGTANTFYYVVEGDWELSDISIQNLSSNDITVSLDSSKKFATITVVGDLPNDTWCEIIIDMYNSVTGEMNNGFYDGLYIYNKKPALKFRWPDWNNGPVENLNNDLQSYYRNAPGYNNPMFFYFVEDGKEVRLTASDLTVSNNILKLYTNSENADAVMVEIVGFGSTTIDYEKNGIVYSLKVDVMLPDIGLYTNNVASKGAFISDFTVTNTEETFYLVATNGWTLTDVTLLGDFSSIANVTIDTSKTYATIKVSGTPENGRYYDIKYEAFNAQYNDYTYGNQEIQIYNGKPSLQFRWPDWNNGPIENLNNDLQSYYRNAPGYNNPIFFYFVENGKEVRLSASDLTVSNNILKLYTSSENADAVMVELLEFGSTTINYEKDGVIYSLNVDVTLPEVGFYTSSVASQGAFIRDFTVTNTEDTFYLVATNGWKLTNVELWGDLASVATMKLDATGSFAKIQITGDLKGDRWYDVRYDAKNSVNNGYMSNNGNSIHIMNGKPRLMFGWMEPDGTHGPLNDFLSIGKEYHTDCLVFLYDGQNETLINASQLTSSDEDVIKITSSPDEPNVVSIKAVDWGTALISYTDVNGDTYSFEVVSELQNLGFYKDDIIHQDNWFTSKFTVTDTEKTFYLMADNGLTIEDVKLLYGAEEYADVQISNDKACVSITITGNPESGSWFALSFISVDKNGQRNSHEYGLEIVNNVCMHGNVKLVDEKVVGCVTDGYTGDEVCTSCGVMVKKGEVIKAIGHDIENVGKKDVTCITDGYTGDEICKTCDAVVKKGEVIKAIGHDYVNGICTNCQDKVVINKPVEDVDTSKPVEEVKAVVQQESADIATKVISGVVDAILSDKLTEEVKESVSEGAIEEIQKEIETGNRITTEIVTDVIKESEIESNTVEMIKEKIGENGTVVQYLDLSVLIKSVSAEGTEKELGKLNTLGEKIEFTIMIPEELIQEGREFYVIRVHEGKTDILDVKKNNDGTYSFETDRFSTYVVAYNDIQNTEQDTSETETETETETKTETETEMKTESETETKTESKTESVPETGDDRCMILWGIYLMIGFCVVFAAGKKRCSIK